LRQKKITYLIAAAVMLFAAACGNKTSTGNANFEKGPTTVNLDPAEYVGLWHISPVVGSGFAERLELSDDSTFIWAASQFDGQQRVRFRAGSWLIDDGYITFSVQEEIRWVGGKDAMGWDSWGTAVCYENPDIVKVSFANAKEYRAPLSEVAIDGEVLDKRTISIGEMQFWELGSLIDVHEIRLNYESEKSKARAATPAGAEPGNHNVFSSYADILEEYWDVMVCQENSFVMTSLGDGKVEVRDIDGDNIPELIFVALLGEYHERLHIFKWDEAQGEPVEIVNEQIRAMPGGGGNYSVFVSGDGALYVYSSQNGESFEYGFWNISNYLEKSISNWATPFVGDPNRAEFFARLSGETGQPILLQINGESISEAQAIDWHENWVVTLDTVLMDCEAVMDGLYTEVYGPWPRYVLYPYGEQCLSWELGLVSMRGDSEGN